MALLLAAGTLSAAAQDLRVRSMVVYKTDGTRDTIMLKPSDSYFYGKENPEDGDYITGNIICGYYSDLEHLYSSSIRIGLQYNYSLTSMGEKAPYTTYGYMISSRPITTKPDLSKKEMLTDAMYFVDNNYCCPLKVEKRQNMCPQCR